ncbi:MAG: RNA polymerase sigma-70 factor [Tannerellaceae bacterium]|jgi:RNA polymerase sigma-70 factor (ECF subfamily)|nr:RNA polymerase sigma-70 factor [Tannerellaceae bacterium]
METRDISEIDKLFWQIALKDDEGAFRSLFLDYFSSLCVFAHRYIESWETCEDVVQDTFYKIWKNRRKLEISASGRNFLITSVRNGCIDYLRRKETETLWKEKELQHNTIYAAENIYSTTELEEILNSALKRLPENVRTVFEQSRFEGKTYADIASGQSISVKTVEAYMTRALKQLRIELKDYLPLILLFL